MQVKPVVLKDRDHNGLSIYYPGYAYPGGRTVEYSRPLANYQVALKFAHLMANDRNSTHKGNEAEMSRSPNIEYVTEQTELYAHFDGQFRPQPALIVLNCDDERLYAAYDPEVSDSEPEGVWHNRTLRWAIPPLRKDAANALLDAITPLAKRIIDGYEPKWDGSNMVGTYNADARSAIDTVAALTEEAYEYPEDHIQAVDANDWLQDWYPHDGATMADIDAICDELQSDAEAEGVDIIHGLREYVTNRVKAE